MKLRLLASLLSQVFFAALVFGPNTLCAQGTWTALRDTAPGLNNGVMLLLTNGNIITTITDDPLAVWDDSCGPAWNKLVPDSTGSYVNGTWQPMAPMHNSRIYFSTWVLQNGKVYAAGGEFGTGGDKAELYDPAADTWSPIPGLPAGFSLSDANSQMLPDGRILQNSVYSSLQGFGLRNFFYDPGTNSFTIAPTSLYPDDEAVWLKLPDNSILYETTGSTSSERYIPELNRWQLDANLPYSLFDNYGTETGAAVMLPDGRALFLGSNGKTAFYTPSGDTTNGQWSTGPPIPNGLGTPDAPATVLPDGKVLCVFAQIPNGSNMDSVFHPLMYFYLFDYTNNTFTQIPGPNGQWTINQPSCSAVLLNLPDGTVLLGVEGSSQYYVYTPAGTPLALAKPAIDTIIEQQCEYMVTGTLFNGITQGTAYGDDWQMATNYPVIRLVANGHTYFAPTTFWNRTGIATGALPDTTYFTVPANVPFGNYSLLLSANGVSCDTFNFQYTNCLTTGSEIINRDLLKIAPNPTTGQCIVEMPAESNNYVAEVYNVPGEKVGQFILNNTQNTIDLSSLPGGMYFVHLHTQKGSFEARVVVVK